MQINKIENRAKNLIKSLFSVPLRNLVLQLIALYGEMHGYEIMKKIEEITMGFWKPSTSTLYMVLDNLVKEGLLESREEYRGKIKRVKYRITEKGLEILRMSIGTTLEILYQIIEKLEDLNKKLKTAKPGKKLITPEDIKRHIETLKKIRDILNEKIIELESKLDTMNYNSSM
ncbi:PadR family transcriptional regulator [Desulfurococcaceae archaeon MEX13E-LK6-19]|nr:PadR family transcriptional regulator [Desulfurococcaceae archaeon MEX13E-LK6-19]